MMFHQVLAKPVRKYQLSAIFVGGSFSNQAGFSVSDRIGAAFRRAALLRHSFSTLDLKKEISMKMFFLTLCLLGLSSFVGPAAHAQDTSTNIVRPMLVDAKVNGAQIAKPASYSVAVGDRLELEYSYPVVPPAIPKTLTSESSDADVLVGKSGPKNVVVPGLMGAGKNAFCFHAKSQGNSTVTLNIDGKRYQYFVSVERSGGDPPNPELCKAVYTAIQFKGRVYIFANGIHPTAGYKTYFKRAMIAIWPPQYSLMCEKPSGVVAHVLTPFSAQTSFEAEQPVASVIITDKGGKQTIKVVQMK